MSVSTRNRRWVSIHRLVDGDGRRWQLVRITTDDHGYVRSPVVLEDHVATPRALELARLLGVEGTIAETLRTEAEQLTARAAARLKRSRIDRADAEELAVEERREADRIRREIRKLEAPDA